MFDKLESVLEKFTDIEHSLIQEGLDGKELTRLTRERGQIEPVVTAYQKYKKIKEDLAGAREMMEGDDAEMQDIAREEVDVLTKELEQVESELRILMLPTDPNDQKNVILEVRAGTGGDEASLFSADLYRMYTRYAERLGWRIEPMSMTEGTQGGYKEIVAMVTGDRVYSRLKFESGTHRVQRVPSTETQGRIHTSACTVAVLPEAEDVDITIDPKDLEISLCRASGAGGQHVNTTDSAVRIVHLPTGVVVECQDERSQHKNKAQAMKVLKARVLEKAEREQADAISAERKSQVGSGDRSERIRTYNFPQGRMTDHRINLTLYQLDDIMGGGVGEVIDALVTDHQANLLKREFGDQI